MKKKRKNNGEKTKKAKKVTKKNDKKAKKKEKQAKFFFLKMMSKKTTWKKIQCKLHYATQQTASKPFNKRNKHVHKPVVYTQFHLSKNTHGVPHSFIVQLRKPFTRAAHAEKAKVNQNIKSNNRTTAVRKQH